MFDISQPISYEQRLPDKVAKLRFPTDEEFIKRQQSRKLNIRNLGNGESETVAADGAEEVDMALFNAIRLGDDAGDEFDEFEAAEAIQQITSAVVIDLDDSHPEGIAVKLEVPGGEVTHIVKVPSRKQLAIYRQSRARVRDGRFNLMRMVLNLEADLKIYKEIAVSAEGYEGEVPVFHAAPVAQAVDIHIQSLNGPRREAF